MIKPFWIDSPIPPNEPVEKVPFRSDFDFSTKALHRSQSYKSYAQPPQPLTIPRFTYFLPYDISFFFTIGFGASWQYCPCKIHFSTGSTARLCGAGGNYSVQSSALLPASGTSRLLAHP